MDRSRRDRSTEDAAKGTHAKELTAADRAAVVVRDMVVDLGWKSRHRTIPDLPAELSAEMVRLRWVIEMFFTTLKQLLGCRHLLSGDHNGVETVRCDPVTV